MAAPALRGRRYPFRLGIASGSPKPDGFVLWTRLVPRLFEPDGGMPDRRVPVDWELATDPRMRRVVRRGTAWALPQLAHSVHVEISGLRPGRDYYYRFRYRHDETEVGHTRTAPRTSDRVDRLTFAAASCQKWEDGFYSAYRAMAEEDLDFVLHLGDYVYEYAIPADGGLPAAAGAGRADRRPRWSSPGGAMQYAITKSDPHLQRAHRRFPFVVTWDDHEVANDYANTQTPAGDISALRAAAYQAWYEHQPGRAGRRSLAGRRRDLRPDALGRPGPDRHPGRPAVPRRPALRLGRGAGLRGGLRPRDQHARPPPGALAATTGSVARRRGGT